MIFEVLNDIQEQLNQHFKLRFSLAEDKLLLSTLVNNDGTNAVENELVVMMPVSMQEEKHLYARNNPATGSPPTVSLNILLLFTTTFTGKSTSEGLKFLSEIISYFLQNNSMDIEGNKISIDFYNVDINEQNSLWASLGAKYTPSVVYKLSLIQITEDMPTSEITFASDFPEDEQ